MKRLLLAVVGLIVFPSLAWPQGVLIVEDPVQIVRLPRPPIIIYPRPEPRPIPVPQPPATYRIQELEVNARLVDQVAQVQVSQSFVNTGSRQLEVSFVFPLPYDGAVDQVTLMVDGKEFPAKLLKAEEARRLYEDIVRKNKDPALLEWMGAGLFKTSVFPVPPGAKRTVMLRYSQLCRLQEGLTDFLFPLSTAKYTSEAPDKVSVRVSIDSQADIKNVYSPTHPVEIKRPDERHAVISFESKNEVPTTDFRLMYDVGKGMVSTRVLSYQPQRDGDRDGFFMLLATPEIKATAERPKKTVLFVVDRSGSMSGKKIEQVKAAAKFILENLREGDLFNIIAYDSDVQAFRPELQKFDDKTRKEALGFIEGIYAGGSTNIDAALGAALKQLQDSSRPNYVLFLTDGLPTAGVTNEPKIVENAAAANKVRARIFTFGVGFDLNARLLEKLSRESHGQSEYVRPNEDIEDRVSRLYRRIESPVMTDVKIELTLDEHKPEQGPPVNRVYPKGSIDLFAGEQLVVVGRYKTPGNAKVVVSGSVNGQAQKFDFPAKLIDRSGDETNAFIEKLWAVRRVGELLDEIDLKGKNDELVKELVELATRHGILTPYTSFLADENTDVRAVTANAARAERRLKALEQTQGEGGVAQRRFSGGLQRAQQSGGDRGAAADAFAMPAAPAGPAMAGRPVAKAEAAPGGGQGFGARGVGSRNGSGVATSPPPVLAPAAESAEKEMAQAEQNMRQVGNRAFYRRNNQWVDSTVSAQQETNAIRVKQFTKEYFDLAARHGRKLSQYLVFDEPVMLNLEGQAYLIEP